MSLPYTMLSIDFVVLFAENDTILFHGNPVFC